MLGGRLLFLMQGALALSPIIFAMGFVLHRGVLKPILIPKSEIERMALDLIDRFNDPEGAAMIEEHSAWYRSDNFQQGKWRRVRKMIARMRETGW